MDVPSVAAIVREVYGTATRKLRRQTYNSLRVFGGAELDEEDPANNAEDANGNVRGGARGGARGGKGKGTSRKRPAGDDAGDAGNSKRKQTRRQERQRQPKEEI